MRVVESGPMDAEGLTPAAAAPRRRRGSDPLRVAILDCIRDHIAQYGYPPSVREIGAYVGLTSTSSVHHQLCWLEADGLLLRAPQRSRAIVLTEAA